MPQECSTGLQGRGSYGLGDVCGKGHMIMQDWIVMAGVGIDAVTYHVIVMVVTLVLLRMALTCLLIVCTLLKLEVVTLTSAVMMWKLSRMRCVEEAGYRLPVEDTTQHY